MWGTPVGSEFRDLMDKWDRVLLRESKERQIRMLVDGQNFVMFFEFEDDIYGVIEPHRVTFARLMQFLTRGPDHPTEDDEVNEDWFNTASFLAVNLSSAVKGKPMQQIFYSSDLDNIKTINKDDAIKSLLLSCENETPNTAIKIAMQAITNAAKGK